MCGIAGMACAAGGGAIMPDTLRAMARSLAHRGPDGEGVYVNSDGCAGLAHRRLAVIDTSPLGAEPMANEDETIWLVCNGEIYNAPELRAALARRGHRFRSRTDIEVILHLYEERGTDAIRELDGMFALALWDDRRKRLLLARDRAGKKPLKYYYASGRIAFASEAKALFAAGVPRILDHAALSYFFAYNHCRGESTGFQGVAKLLPGHYAVFERGRLSVTPYWQPQYKADFPHSIEEARAELTRLLERAVKRRLASDVPVGIFLSGGIDSAAIVACAHRLGAHLDTFSVGFHEANFDESCAAAALARHFGCRHTRVPVTAQDAMRALPPLVAAYEEPYADASALPLFILARAARPSITVALTGDGGDEAFGGYRRYAYWGMLHRIFPRIYTAIATRWYLPPARLFPLLNPAFAARVRAGAMPQEQFSAMDGMLAYAFTTFLPDDLLVKLDVATMAHGLEARCPFLDRALLDFAFRIPAAWKIKGMRTKVICRDAFAHLLPRAIVRAPKRGFELPVDAWLRGPLYHHARDTILSSAALRAQFNARALERMLLCHRRGARRHGHRIWMLMCFALWQERYIAGSG